MQSLLATIINFGNAFAYIQVQNEVHFRKMAFSISNREIAITNNFFYPKHKQFPLPEVIQSGICKTARISASIHTAECTYEENKVLHYTIQIITYILYYYSNSISKHSFTVELSGLLLGIFKNLKRFAETALILKKLFRKHNRTSF